MVGLKGGNSVEQGGDVLLGGEMGRGTRRGAQLEVNNTVVGEVTEDRGGGVADGGRVGEEVVDVAAEEGEEACRVLGVSFWREGEKWAHVLRS